VPNDLSLDRERSFLFLTGPNMAGKTTFMKALGSAVYLAHVGMSVPARRLVVGGLDTVTSSLHVEDNLERGHSFFYSEVRRVKEVAASLQAGRRQLVLFDELFKGTNVKDAIDGSSLVIEGLLRWSSSLFVLSSHLIELEESLAPHPRIRFFSFESAVEEGRPRFSYRLRPGVSRERLGMLILENEGIPALLRPTFDAAGSEEHDAGLTRNPRAPEGEELRGRGAETRNRHPHPTD
jgi:DNA mismatch repair ATPase MutS